jgi:hypothetical protein
VIVARPLRKSDFANPDARTRCPTPDCWGDLVLFPTGEVDVDGVPSFQNQTVCPLCGQRFELAPDVDDRELYLRIAWLRANQHPNPGFGPRRRI